MGRNPGAMAGGVLPGGPKRKLELDENAKAPRIGLDSGDGGISLIGKEAGGGKL